MDYNSVQQARKIIQKSTDIIILAGAGMSADLGTPTYYTGDMSKYGSNTSQYGYTAYEHAWAPLWLEARETQMKYYRETWAKLLGTQTRTESSPYVSLINYLTSTGKGYFVSTTNVDSAFARTDFDPQRVHEIHGAHRFSQCLDNPDHGVYPTVDPNESFTRCLSCGGDSRPNVMYFLDFDFNGEIVSAQNERYHEYLDTLDPKTTAVLEIGVGETVKTLRYAARRLSAVYRFPIIRINPDKDPGDIIPNVESHLIMNASAGLSALLANQ